jgi:hypothetical protein
MCKLSLIILILLIISICLIFKNEIIQRPILLLPIFLCGLLVLLNISGNNTEYMTNEAIANCASLFNGGNAKVENLEVTGNLTVRGSTTSIGDIITPKGITIGNTSLKDGELKLKNWNSFQDHNGHYVIKGPNGGWHSKNTPFFIIYTSGAVDINSPEVYNIGEQISNLRNLNNTVVNLNNTCLKNGNNVRIVNGGSKSIRAGGDNTNNVYVCDDNCPWKDYSTWALQRV